MTTPLKDDLGRPVAVGAVSVRRIVSLSPAATENLFALGAGNLVVGDTTACDYPPPAARLPRVGNFYQPEYERIRALRPDLIVVESATATKPDMDLLQTKCGGVPVYVMQSRAYADVPRQLLRLGLLTGHARDAERLARQMNAVAAEVGRKVVASRRGRRPPTVFIQVDTSALYAAGPGTFIDDLIRRAGGVNIVKGGGAYPQVSREFLLAARPDFYFITAPGPLPAGVPPLDPALRGLPAIAAGHVRWLDANLVSRPTPRLAEGLRNLAEKIGPK